MKRKIEPENDSWGDKLVKLIPTETVAAFLAVFGLVNPSGAGTAVPLIWGSLIVLMIITPFYLRNSGVTSLVHLIASSLSFFIWSINIAGSFLFPELPKEIFPVTLILWTTVIPLIIKP